MSTELDNQAKTADRTDHSVGLGTVQPRRLIAMQSGGPPCTLLNRIERILTMIEYDREKIHFYQMALPPGTRVLLLHMNEDPRPIPDNTKGTVDFVDDSGQIHCHFDIGRSHTIVPGVDIFRKLTPQNEDDAE